MSIVQIKIDNDANILKYITLIRKFNSALSIQTIKSNIKNGHYVVSHDLYAYNVVDELLEIDHTARFRQLLAGLKAAKATLHIYCDNELITLQYLDNLIVSMHETDKALQQEMDRFLGEE